mgnify:CR=1 FL=1
MAKVAARQTVLVGQNLGTNGPEWRQYINLEFIPDEMIVRSICYRYDGTELYQGFIFTDLVKDSIIGTYADGLINNPNSVFTMKKQVKGQFLFKMMTSLSNLDQGDGTMLAILEFIKYE